jgi:hypothetical protein
VVAKVGDNLSAIVVTWDRDFERLVSRVPVGNYEQCLIEGDFRMIVQIQESGLKLT